jgi:hypothetical protein
MVVPFMPMTGAIGPVAMKCVGRCISFTLIPRPFFASSVLSSDRYAGNGVDRIWFPDTVVDGRRDAGRISQGLDRRRLVSRDGNCWDNLKLLPFAGGHERRSRCTAAVGNNEIDAARHSGGGLACARAPGVALLAVAGVDPQRAFHADAARKQRIDVLVTTGRSGKRKYPEHWTGKKVRERAAAVGEEAMYVEAYPQMSWFVHAGPAGTAGISKEGLEHVFAMGHSLIQRIFIGATRACADVTKISSLEQFDNWLQGISLKTGEIIAAEQVKLLEARHKHAAPQG